VERNGVLCANGRHGCLEGYCGGDAFLERARSYGIQLATPADVWQQAESNFAAKSLCEDYVSRLAQGLGIAITLLDPARLVVGGSLPAALGEKLLTPLRQGLRDFCPSRPYRNLQLAAAQLGQDAAALGAIALAHENNSISVNP
jgi:predicted NBD/HSP70 family sugar kinase